MSGAERQRPRVLTSVEDLLLLQCCSPLKGHLFHGVDAALTFTVCFCQAYDLSAFRLVAGARFELTTFGL